MGYSELIVLGGDDADWINKGVDRLGFCARQLDGFHLARLYRRGWENGKQLYDAIHSGEVSQLADEDMERSGKIVQTWPS